MQLRRVGSRPCREPLARAKAVRVPQSVVCAASKPEQVPLAQRVLPSLLAASLVISSGVQLVQPLRVLADEEEASGYDRKLSALEKRRELLRQARERAQAASSGAAEQTPVEPAPAPAAPSVATPSLKANKGLYEKEAAKAPSLKSVAPIPQPDANSPFAGLMTGPSFTAPAPPAPKLAAPTPAPPPPAPKPAPAPVRPAVVVEAPKPPPLPKPAAPAKAPEAPKPAPTQPGKRRGPLPLWFTELLVLGSFAGLVLAVTKYSEQSAAATQAAAAKVVEAYRALEKLLPSGSSS